MTGLTGNNAITGAGYKTNQPPYEIDQSLRFEPNASLIKAFGSSGNRKTWTFSGWVKRSKINSGAETLIACDAGPTVGAIEFVTADQLTFYDYTIGGAYQSRLVTTALYRDPSSWYHVVVAYDTTQVTAANRIKLFVNGEQVTDFGTETYPSQDFEGNINYGNASNYHSVGRNYTFSDYFDGYLAEVNFIDGQALAPASFGETNSATNQWQAIEYAGSYGTNGFYQKYQDSSALGDDSSGNTNDFTATNLVATDQVLDSPTRNYCTLNPLDKDTFSGYSLAEGNLEMKGSAASDTGRIRSTFNIDSGKWYWEVNLLDVASSALNVNTEVQDISYAVTRNAGDTGGYNRNWASSADNGIVMVAFNADIGALWYGYNGTWDGSATSSEIAAGTTTNANFSSMSTTATYAYRYVDQAGGSGASRATHNFGQDSSFAGNKTAQGNGGDGEDFYYTPPTGYKALNSSNLDDPAIALPGDYFNTLLYTSNNSTLSVTGAGFQPDFIWFKNRTNTNRHALFDSVRGATKRIASDKNEAEAADPDTLISFDSDGWSIGADTGQYGVNYTAGSSFVSWNWKAGGTASSNGDGSITSSVSANPTAGFSIVSYTGTGANATVGHGLSQAPELIIFKNLPDTEDWIVYSEPVGSGGGLFLNHTNGTDADGLYFNSTSPTSSVFTVGSQNRSNGSSNAMIAYAFHSIESYSKVGSYTGNANADGPFIYTGFRPAFFLWKNTTGYSWGMTDNKRAGYNPKDYQLYANASEAEATSYHMVDFLSNGVKITSTDGTSNGSGNEIIFMAFAESPFKTSNAR